MKLAKIALFACVLSLAITVLAACGGDEAAPSTSSAAEANPVAAQPAEANPSAASVELPSDPKAAILQAMRAQLTAGPYRTTTTITLDGSDQTSVGTMIPPDRLHVTLDMGGIKQEMIYIGDKVWSKQGDEAWQASDNLGAPGGGLVSEEMVADMENTITAATLVGPEVVAGVDTLLYTFTSDLNKSTLMQFDSVSQIKIWVNTATGLIVRQEIEDTQTDAPSKTVQVIEYDPTITIEPPVQ